MNNNPRKRDSLGVRRVAEGAKSTESAALKKTSEAPTAQERNQSVRKNKIVERSKRELVWRPVGARAA